MNVPVATVYTVIAFSSPVSLNSSKPLVDAHLKKHNSIVPAFSPIATFLIRDRFLLLDFSLTHRGSLDGLGNLRI